VAPAAKNPPATSAAPAAAKSAEPAGSGFAIQVAALRESGEADAMVKRLAGKGYPAYVVAPAKGQPSVYRVRVGKFKDRHEADTVAARLQKEEQFKPWVVR
jgi:cell division septation protein DedD